MRLKGPTGAEESKEIPRAVGRWVVVCREGDAAVSELSGATCCAGAGAAHPISQAHVGLWEQGEQTGDEGWLGLQPAPVLSSHWWTVSGLHFHLEKCRIFLLGLTHQLRDLHLHVNDIVWMVFLGFLS